LAVLGALFSGPRVGADVVPVLNAGEHEHGTNLAVYVEWQTNRLLLHYEVPANKTCLLQFLAVANATNLESTFLNAPWVNLPGIQASRLPFGRPYAMFDYSITNRNKTNLGRIYRLKVT